MDKTELGHLLLDGSAEIDALRRLRRALARVAEEAVRLWEKGERTPRPAMQRRIMEITGRLVTPMDFMASEAA